MQSSKPEKFAVLILTTDSNVIQKYIWRLWAASDHIKHSNYEFAHIKYASTLYAIMACVQAPKVLLIGNFQISIAQSIYNICQNCYLTNCVDPQDKG